MNGAARLQAVAAAVLFSTGGAAIKLQAFSGLQVSALRSGIAAVALLLVTRRRLVWSVPVLAIGVVYASVLTLFVLATKLTTAANAIFLQSTAPIYLLVLGPLVLAEPIRRRDVVCVGAIGVGMVLCFLGQPAATATAPNPALGNLLAAACGVAWAVTLVSLRWAQRGQTSDDVGLSAVVAGNLIASLAAFPFSWPLPAASPGAWATVIYLGVFQIAAAYLFLTRAVRDLPALDVALLLLLEPVLNPIWAWAVRGERPVSWTLAGGALIVAAAATKSALDAAKGTKTT